MPEESKKAKKVHVVDVVRVGEKLILPAAMKIIDAIEVLQRRLKYEEEQVVITEQIDGFVWDGAYAFARAMEKRYGWVSAEPTGFFQDNPPKLISVEISATETVNVPWGKFTVPGVDGFVQTSYTQNRDGMIVFQIQAQVKRMFEGEVKELAKATRDLLKETSIYKGKAIKLRFRDEDGEKTPLPIPKFLDVSTVDENLLVFPEHTRKAVNTNLFKPLTHRAQCARYGIPFKRGVLLAGPYGTGKTFAAYVAARKATENGISYIYCENVADFQDVIQFAAQYAPAVVFCEDIDRVVSGERDVTIDQILNTIDGIESKTTQVMVVLTTNAVERIHQAMIRPGRLDAVIEVERPDGIAVEKLIRQYGKGLIPAEENLAGVGELLQGQIPAVIREVVERSKLSAIPDNAEDVLVLHADNLEEAARTMTGQLALLNREERVTPSELQKLGNAIGISVQAGMEYAVRRTEKGTLDRIVKAEVRTN